VSEIIPSNTWIMTSWPCYEDCYPGKTSHCKHNCRLFVQGFCCFVNRVGVSYCGINHTHPLWLWGHGLFKILSPGSVFYGTKWLLSCPHKLSPTFHSKCGIDRGLIIKGKHNSSLKVAVEGPDYYGHPLCIHSFIILWHICSWQELWS
jgi:hypothetical protein